MINRMVVQEALKHSWQLDDNPGEIHNYPADNQDSVVSILIYNIFGGEILKTPKNKGWHFYNRIDGERIDFTRSDIDKSSEENPFEDIPSTPDEACNYFEQEDYSIFFMRFIREFEEAVGLEKNRPDYTA